MQESVYWIYVSAGFITLLISLGLTYYKQRENTGFYLLLLAIGLLAFGCISIDPFLHFWDERYHALVALNTISDPFVPKLFMDDLPSRAYHSEWYISYIWMHKGPAFTWQMALSMALFGKNVIAMRIPSALMIVLITFSVYKTNKLHFPKVAYVTALLVGLSPLLYAFASGRQGMDHNDLAFTAFISGSFYTFSYYLKSEHWKWVVFTGIFISLAILTKWFAGSLILFMWGLYILLFRIKSIKSWMMLIACGAVVLLITGSWFLYCYINFKEVLLREFELNGASHLFTQLDGHITTWNFHLDIWYKYFLPVFASAVIGAVAIFKTHRGVKQNLAWVTLVAIVLVMTVFSLAKTRLIGYTIILLPLYAYLAALGLEWVWQKIEGKKTLLMALTVMIIGFSGYKFIAAFKDFEMWDVAVEDELKIKVFYEGLHKSLPENAMIFNSEVTPVSMQFIEAMFYSQRLVSEYIPTAEDLKEAKDAGYIPVLILNDKFTESDLKQHPYLATVKTVQYK